MYKACIFDLDGTLTDTLESLLYSVNQTMKEMGMQGITKDQCRRFVGNGAGVLIEKTLKAAGDHELVRYKEAYRIYQRVFDQNCTYHVVPYDGVPGMLAEMKQMGMKLGVLSNKPDRQAVHVVQSVFGTELFDEIQGQRENVPRKPDPAAALAMAGRFGVDPREMLYIGDSEVDAATGKAAGMDTVLVLWGFRSRQELQGTDPFRMVSSAEEIVELIKNGRERDEQLQ